MTLLTVNTIRYALTVNEHEVYLTGLKYQEAEGPDAKQLAALDWELAKAKVAYLKSVLKLHVVEQA